MRLMEKEMPKVDKRAKLKAKKAIKTTENNGRQQAVQRHWQSPRPPSATDRPYWLYDVPVPVQRTGRQYVVPVRRQLRKGKKLG